MVGYPKNKAAFFEVKNFPNFQTFNVGIHVWKRSLRAIYLDIFWWWSSAELMGFSLVCSIFLPRLFWRSGFVQILPPTLPITLAWNFMLHQPLKFKMEPEKSMPFGNHHSQVPYQTLRPCQLRQFSSLCYVYLRRNASDSRSLVIGGFLPSRQVADGGNFKNPSAKEPCDLGLLPDFLLGRI